MQEYLVTVPAEASGRQWYTVKAESAEDAIERLKAGEGVFSFEELEVTHLKYDRAEAKIND